MTDSAPPPDAREAQEFTVHTTGKAPVTVLRKLINAALNAKGSSMMLADEDVKAFYPEFVDVYRQALATRPPAERLEAAAVELAWCYEQVYDYSVAYVKSKHDGQLVDWPGEMTWAREAIESLAPHLTARDTTREEAP